MLNKLIKIGFSENEALIYKILIDSGQSKASLIIKKTGLHRNVVYTTLDKFIFRKYVIKVI